MTDSCGEEVIPIKQTDFARGEGDLKDTHIRKLQEAFSILPYCLCFAPLPIRMNSVMIGKLLAPVCPRHRLLYNKPPQASWCKTMTILLHS